jgi:hypothetical protein
VTPAQQSALEALVGGRPLAEDELTEIEPLLNPDARNDVAIAAILSVGRTKQTDVSIGIGDILNTLRGVGSGGGVFLDTLQSLGVQDRDLFYVYKLLEAGTLHINLPNVQEGLQQLATAVPSLAPQIAALSALGIEPDLVQYTAVSDALNKAEGRLTL